MSDQSEIGADAVAHVEAAVAALDDPMHVRALFASILAIPLRQADPASRMGLAARFFADACRILENDGDHS